MKEAALEAACCRHALVRGVPSKKLQTGIVGDPDRLFMLPGQRCWFVEFKSPLGRLSPRQQVVHGEHLARGHPVTVIRSTWAFKVALDLELQAAVD